MTSRILEVYREVGLGRLPWWLFSYAYKSSVRRVLPLKSPVLYGGVPIADRRMGDALLSGLYDPPLLDDLPGYEEALVAALKANVRAADTVVVVGAGRGVTTVVAAIAASKGSVRCFEGNLGGVRAARRVAKLNGVHDRITIEHAVVGQAIGVYGNELATRVVAPVDLPKCDVLELDCEGSEVGILRDMLIEPRVVLVETHGFLGAPTEVVRGVLEARGYVVEDKGWAEPRELDACAKQDIRVLVGTRRDGVV